MRIPTPCNHSKKLLGTNTRISVRRLGIDSRPLEPQHPQDHRYPKICAPLQDALERGRGNASADTNADSESHTPEELDDLSKQIKAFELYTSKKSKGILTLSLLGVPIHIPLACRRMSTGMVTNLRILA